MTVTYEIQGKVANAAFCAGTNIRAQSEAAG
jgi:hypothetical protein